MVQQAPLFFPHFSDLTLTVEARVTVEALVGIEAMVSVEARYTVEVRVTVEGCVTLKLMSMWTSMIGHFSAGSTRPMRIWSTTGNLDANESNKDIFTGSLFHASYVYCFYFV